MTDAEIRELATTTDIVRLAMLADDLRRGGHGERVTFVRVAHRSLDDLGGLDQLPASAGELRLTGAPESLGQAVEAVRVALERAPEVPLSAFTFSALAAMAGRSGETPATCLRELRASGLRRLAEVSLDGPEAEVAARLALVREAGLRVGRLGWMVASSDWIGELTAARGIGGVETVAPLPRGTDTGMPATGYEDLKHVALARLVVGADANVQVDWQLAGAKLAQVALTCGANDLDNVPVEEGPDGRGSVLQEVRRNIEAASFTAVERDGTGAARV